MKRLREILMPVAMEEAAAGKETYMLVPISVETTIGQLQKAEAFAKYEDIKLEEPVIQEAVQKPKTEKVDHGKLIALHKAGWKNAEIARELHCTIQSVINHIKLEEEK